MVNFEDVTEDRPVRGAGVRDMIEEEEQVGGGADSTSGRMPSSGHGDDDALPSPTISSASESVPAPTARDLQRVKRGLVRATEHPRESLADTKERIWENIDDEVQERKQEALTFQKLLDDRIEMMSNVPRGSRQP